MHEVPEIEDLDAGTFIVIAPEGLELLEELLEEISRDLTDVGTKVCLATEVLSEQFCTDID